MRATAHRRSTTSSSESRRSPCGDIRAPMGRTRTVASSSTRR
jgi:hypothetical protein